MSAWRLGVSPAAAITAHRAATERVLVVNESGRPMRLQAQAETCNHGAASWAHVSPRVFTLKAGAERHVYVAIQKAPTGRQDTLITFSAPTAGQGNVKVRGAVASVLQTGTGQSHTCVSLSAPEHSSPLPLALVSALAFCVLLACLWLGWRRMKGGGAHRG